jgi:hypothetical protein
MAENVFNQFLPDDVKQDQNIKSGNVFDIFIPNDVKNQPLQNEFKIDQNPDDKFLFKNLELDMDQEDPFNQFLPSDVKDKESIKLFSDDQEEFGIGDAFKLGLTDTIRGITQIVGGEKVYFMEDTLKEQQAKLNAAMQGEGGGLIAAAYFGGAILDPVQWLIPVLRGKNLYQMAKFGAVSGALAGALGYVDETSFFKTRAAQAGAGAVGGAILTPALGKILQVAKVRKLKKSFGLDQEAPDIKDIPEDQLVKVRLPGKEDVTIGLKDKRGKKVKGRGEEVVQIRKNIKIKPIEQINDMPGSLNKNKQNNKNFILRGPREFFKSILGNYVKPVVSSVTEPIVKGVGKTSKLYQSKIGRPAFNYFTAEKGLGPELGGGLVGAATGFSLPEADNNTKERFSRAVLGFMAGAAGMHVGGKVKIADDLTLTQFLGKNLIDGYKLPKEIKKLQAEDLGGLRGKLELDALRIAQEAQQLTVDERRVLYNMLEGDITYDVPSKTLNRIAKKARENITKVTQMYIQAGLITEETALRNIQRYIRRTYGGEDLAKIGSELRARGVLEEISPKEWVEKYSKTKAFTLDDTGKSIPLENHNGWELFGNIKIGNKSEKATPELIKKLAKDPTKANDRNVNVRWEYTKQERLGMDEIEDGAFAILETGRLMSKTLPQYKFYADIAELPFVKTKPSQDEIEESKLIKMPLTVRDGTIQPIYGKLAGKFVPKEVYDNLVAIYKASEKPTGFFKAYRKLNQVWKSSKTAWNPTVHVNNIVSNFVLTDLVDGNLGYLVPAAKAFRAAANGKSSKVLEEAQKHGVFDVDYVTKELEFLDPKNIQPNFYKVSDDKDFAENAVNIATGIYQDLIKKEKLGLQKLSEYYRSEDAIFRLALFMDRLDKGYSVSDAALDARKSFIDYNISAPGINLLRNSVTPFLAYTYRVIPILAETAIVRPWKFVKYAVAGYALNNAGELLGEGAPEAERAAMAEQKQGRVFGLPFLPHRNIKLPNAALPGQPEGSFYIDITRYVPGGDVLDLGSGTALPLMPAPLQPSFGVAGDVLFPMVGYDLFRKDKIKGQGISDFDDLLIRSKAVGSRLIPNFPFVPFSYSTKRIERAREEKPGPLKQDRTELIAFLNTIGIKINRTDITRLKAIKSFEFRRKVRGIQEQIRIEAGKFNRGEISQLDYNKEVDKLNKKYEVIKNRYIKAVNVPVETQEAVPLSEFPSTIGTAVKEKAKDIGTQFKELFDKDDKEEKEDTFKQFLPKE